MIKEVYILKDIILYNKHHEQYYYSKKGVIVIINNDKNIWKATQILQILIISKSEKLIKQKKQMIFKNIIYNEELLTKLSNE